MSAIKVIILCILMMASLQFVFADYSAPISRQNVTIMSTNTLYGSSSTAGIKITTGNLYLNLTKAYATQGSNQVCNANMRIWNSTETTLATVATTNEGGYYVGNFNYVLSPNTTYYIICQASSTNVQYQTVPSFPINKITTGGSYFSIIAGRIGVADRGADIAGISYLETIPANASQVTIIANDPYIPQSVDNFTVSGAISGNATIAYSFLASGLSEITMSKINYRNYTFNATPGYFYNITLPLLNSLYITYYDEITGAVINQATITTNFISDQYAYKNSTTNGFGVFYLVQPGSYKISTIANGYSTRYNYYSFTNNSANSTNIYLYNTSSVSVQNVTVTVTDVSARIITNALVRVLTYDYTTNQYILRESVLTDYTGKAYFSGILYNSQYQFRVEYPIGNQVLQQTQNALFVPSVALVIPATFVLDNNYQASQQITGAVTFNNATGVFQYSWSDPTAQATSYCLTIYNADGSTYNQSCSSSSIGSSFIQVNTTIGSYYLGVGTSLIKGEKFVESQYIYENIQTDWGLSGIFVVFLVTCVLVFMFREDPIVAVMSVPLPVTFATWFGIVALQGWVPVVVIIICGGVAIMLRYA